MMQIFTFDVEVQWHSYPQAEVKLKISASVFFFLWMLPWSRFYVRKERNNERKHVVNNRTEGNCHRLFSPTVSTSYWRWWNCASAQNIKQYYLRPKPSHLCWRICKKKKKKKSCATSKRLGCTKMSSIKKKKILYCSTKGLILILSCPIK